MIKGKKVQLLRFLIGRLGQNMADGNYNCGQLGLLSRVDPLSSFMCRG